MKRFKWYNIDIRQRRCVIMQIKQRVHLEIQTHRKNPRGLIRTSIRKDGKNTHETISTLTGLTMEQLVLIQAALQGNVVLKKDFVIKNSKEYGASYAFLQLAKDLGLDKMIYSRSSETWVQDCLATVSYTHLRAHETGRNLVCR